MIFPKYCFQLNENNIEINFILTLFQNLIDLNIATKIRQVHKRFINLPITLLFGTTRRAIKFLDSNCLYISKVLVFLDYILFLAKAQDKIKSKKRKFLSKKIYKTANQNNSVINSYYQCLGRNINIFICISWLFKFTVNLMKLCSLYTKYTSYELMSIK